MPDKTLLTLYTCSTDAGVERLVVQAELVEEVKIINATPEQQAIFVNS